MRHSYTVYLYNWQAFTLTIIILTLFSRTIAINIWLSQTKTALHHVPLVLDESFAMCKTNCDR